MTNISTSSTESKLKGDCEQITESNKVTSVKSIKHPCLHFVNLLSKHPFYKDKPFLLDIEAHPSAYLLSKHNNNNGNGRRLSVISYKGLVDEKMIELLHKANTKGFHVYYRVNHHGLEGNEAGRYIKNADITNALYILVDIDFKLPFAVSYLFTRLGIHAWSIVQTSIGSEGFKRYQALIAIDVADSFKLEEVKRVGLSLASLIGSDASVCDARRVARLAGFRNWKGMEEGHNAGLAKLVSYEKAGSKVYKLSELERLISLAGNNEDIKRCKSLSPSVASRKKQEQEKQEKGINIYTENGVNNTLSYKEMLDYIDKGHKVASKGERHNVVLSAVGGLANDTAKGRLSKEEAHQKLDLIVGGVEGSLEEKEVARVHQYLDKYSLSAVADIKKREEERTEEGIKKLTPLGASTSTETDIGSKSSFEIAGNRGAFFKKMFKKESELEKFLLGLFKCLTVIKQNDGFISDLSWLVLQRAKQQELIVEQFFCVPAVRKSKWGKKCKQQLTFTGDIEEGLLGELTEQLYKYVIEYRGILEKQEEIQKDIKQLEASIRSECTDLTGVVNELEYARRVREAKIKFFTFKFSKSLRKHIQLEIAHSIKEIQQQVNSVDLGGNESKSSRICYQNGWLQCSDSKLVFTECEAWKETLSSMSTNYDVELGEKVKQVLEKLKRVEEQKEIEFAEGQTKQDAIIECYAEYEKLLMSECYHMYTFLNDAFPSQPATWMLVMNIIGYCFLVNNPAQIFFNFIGVGGSGKGTLGKIITYLCGDHSSEHISFSSFASDTGGLYSAIGKTAVVVDEVDSSLLDRKIKGAAWSKLKAVTGATPIAVRQLYKNEIKVKLGTKFILISNEPLAIPDVGGAGERRIVSLMFNEPVPILRQVEDKALDILREDADKIASIAGATLASRVGKGRSMFSVLESLAAREGKEAYLGSSSPVRAVLERCVVKNADFRVSAKAGEISKSYAPVDLLIACCEALIDTVATGKAVEKFKDMSGKEKEKKVLDAIKAMGIKREKEDRISVGVRAGNERYKAVKNVRIKLGAEQLREVLTVLWNRDQELAKHVMVGWNLVFVGEANGGVNMKDVNNIFTELELLTVL